MPVVSFVPVISVLIRMRSLPVRGGDPFSHPSGSSVTRPARVTDQTAVPGLASAHGARPPPVIREPENIQCPTVFIQWRQMVARAVLRQRGKAAVLIVHAKALDMRIGDLARDR